ncbi:uncharacterized protein MEPE_00365 [Melanopsichium pennsylvanicum]|uniref:Uncharacterized protein n=2 Tax=Melanopsichium pennsylvanicum TaxID=63383 RepID=A0AAJ5C2K5_9BASI|nr:putative protein [Melanopsichium pennsylvanicum 4]SNX81660.1 uncharacterized protein MEPE_00365 [Melanopsichium pennsylvanicum]
MSILNWLVLAVITYLINRAYQSLQLSRKKAEFIRDRRRAAGIHDDDHRPFAVARADALSRRYQQKHEEHLSTPVKKRTLSPLRPQTSIDHEAAARLSGIPGTLPGYLKDSFADNAGTKSAQRRPYQASPSIIPSSPRSPSPVKHRSISGNSSQTSSRYPESQLYVIRTPRTRDSLANGAPDVGGSPVAQRALKRRHQASPVKNKTSGHYQSKAQKLSIPGDFSTDQEATDAGMSDASHSPAEDDSKAMDEDEYRQSVAQGEVRPAGESQLKSLQTSARATAKKREADELDASDTEQSINPSDDHDYIESQHHSSKRSRTVNQQLDPGSSLDFDIALPEEAMTDFDPVQDAFLASDKSRVQVKRQADTSDDRQPGEEWTDFEGLRWRIHPETRELQRWSGVLEWRPKYRMPRDSLHPMAKESHQVVVHKWLTKDEWEDVKSKKLLSFQEPERLAEKEKLEKEEAEKMRRKQELLAKIRQTSSPNKRIQSYLVQQQRRQLQHKLSRSELSGDVSMNSYVTNETDEDGDGTSMSIESSSMIKGSEGTPNKPRSRRISLQNGRMSPARTGVGSTGAKGLEGRSSGNASPSETSIRPRGSPLISPYRSIAYPKSASKKGTSSPLVTSFFPAPDSSSTP